MKITKWAIRRKTDGFYMPRSGGRYGRGGSHMEPVEASSAMDIRLFHAKHAAKKALAAWLKGRYITSRGSYTPHDSNFSEPYEETTIEPQPDRKKEDFEVVEVTVILP